MGGWIKLRKEEFGELWSGMGLACGRGIRNAWRILSEKSERKKKLSVDCKVQKLMLKTCSRMYSGSRLRLGFSGGRL